MNIFPGSEFFYDYSLSMIERWYCRFFGVPIVGLRIRWRILSKLLPQNAHQILDAGCGRGVISRMLACHYTVATVDAIDQDAIGQNRNHNLAVAMGLKNCDFIVRDLTNLTAKNEYDLIVSIDNLEHITADQDVLNILFQALKSKGKFIVHVPHYYRRWPVFKWRANFNVPGHVRPGYHQAEILEKVRRAGFEIERTGFSYGFLENLANNIGYAITGAEEKNKLVYAVLFPMLNVMAWLGNLTVPRFGAGVWIVGFKPV